MYSFGVVLWELWERRRPFEDLRSRFDIADTVAAGGRPTIGRGCPPQYAALVRRCWHQVESDTLVEKTLRLYVQCRKKYLPTACLFTGLEACSFSPTQAMGSCWNDATTLRAGSYCILKFSKVKPSFIFRTAKSYDDGCVWNGG